MFVTARIASIFVSSTGVYIYDFHIFTVIISSFFFHSFRIQMHMLNEDGFRLNHALPFPSPISSSTISTTPEAILKLVKMSLDGY